MNLLQKIRNSFTNTDEAAPAAASFAIRPDTIYAPISGMLVSMPEINDEIISSGLLGDGYGILPVGNVIYAPATGRIDTVTVTNHAIGVLTSAGHEILIHVGIDTVKMEGKGFKRLVEAGDQVVAGQPLLTFDPAAIAAAGYEDMVSIVLFNPEAFSKVRHVGESSTLIDNRPLVKVGDPLIVAKP